MGTKSYVYTADSASFTLAGSTYDVMALTLNLELGAIPEVIVGFVPEQGGNKGTNIHELSLSDLCSSLDKLAKASENMETGDVSISLSRFDAAVGKGGGSEKFSIDLNGWILKGAGIDNVTTTQAFCMTCTLAHPAYRLCVDGGFYTNVGCSVDLTSCDPTDIIDAGAKAYEKLSDAMNTQELKLFADQKPVKPSGFSPKQILDRIKLKISMIGGSSGKLKQYLKWDGPARGLPLQSDLSGPELLALKYLLCESWLHHDGGSDHSVWDVFMSLASSTGCVLVPEYDSEDGKLPVVPRFPWSDPEYEIDESDAYSIILPGTDDAPLFGVCSTPGAFGGLGEKCDTYDVSAGELNEIAGAATSLAFVPSDSDKNGAFITVSIPPWLDSVAALSAGFNDQMNTSQDMKDDIPHEDKTSGDNDSVKAKNTASMNYLSYVFCSQYKVMVQSRVNCRFMPKVGDKTLYPGKSAAVKTSGGGTLFEGYVTTVSHHITMSSGKAMTNITMTHCRPAGGYDVIKGYGGENPLYH